MRDSQSATLRSLRNVIVQSSRKRVQLIAASITAIEFIYPIVVHVGKDGPVLDQGQHRLEAAKSLGWKRIRCLVSEG